MCVCAAAEYSSHCLSLKTIQKELTQVRHLPSHVIKLIAHISLWLSDMMI